MKNLDCARATTRIVSHDKTRVIALSGHLNSGLISIMLEAGVSAFLPKNSDIDELVHAVHAVAAGRTYLSPSVTDIVVTGHFHNGRDGPTRGSELLSGRERQVLLMLVQGYSVREIAQDLFVSIKTVQSHRQHIMQKLNITSIPGLVKYAIREGLVALYE
jgi:DNA-binding NarL/FixJ family response regulator